MAYKYELNVVDIRSNNTGSIEGKSIFNFENIGTKSEEKPSASLWGPLDETIITGHDNGTIAKWDMRDSEGPVNEPFALHRGRINDMQYSKDQTMIITASKDNSAAVSLNFVLFHWD